MELLIASIVTVLTQLGKPLVKRIKNKKLVKAATLILVFVLSVGATLAWKYWQGELDWMDCETVVESFFIAVGYYELIVKRIIEKVFTNLEK